MSTWTDAFCGAGGSSTGIEQAGGHVIAAINHWPTAITTHQLNHPGTEHVCCDISQADPARFPRTEFAWFSTSCTHHTNAQGRRRHRSAFVPTLGSWDGVRDAEPDSARATMFDVIRFSEHHRYRGVIVENVPEVRDWQLFPWWVDMMTGGLGYDWRPVILDSSLTADLGPAVPQSRRRIYMLFWSGGGAPATPSQQHVAPGADSILDDQPGPLIADRPRPLAASTTARIEATLDRYPDRRLIVSYYGASKVGKPATEPLGTLTTHDRHALITRGRDGIHYRMLSLGEQVRAMGFPDTYRWAGTRADITKQIGNAVTPNCARDISAALMAAAGRKEVA